MTTILNTITIMPSRAPLAALPLARYHALPNSTPIFAPGSPTKLMLSPGLSSVPCKRSAPSPSPTTTPKARRIVQQNLASPARRLFGETPETPESSRTTTSSSSRTLAPSPPITASPRQLERNLDPHDPGFTIFADASSPPSRPCTTLRRSYHGPSTPVDKSPASIETDQENVPPAQEDSYVHLPSPSVHLSSPSTARTVRKRSKLAHAEPPEEEEGGEEGEEEDLTPGRTKAESRQEREARRRRLLGEV